MLGAAPIDVKARRPAGFDGIAGPPEPHQNGPRLLR